MSKESIISGVCIGMIIGIVISVIIATVLISTIGNSFQIENMNITIALNQTQIEDLIRESIGYQSITKAEVDISGLEYNGIYGWFCEDTSSYEPAIFDVRQSYIDRGCYLISIDRSSVNRSYYREMGWD